MKKISAYTKAQNCTDVADCKVGIDEIRVYLKSTKTPCQLAYNRLGKLKKKLEAFENKASNMHPIFSQALAIFGIK